MKQLFLSMISLSIMAFLSACDSRNTGEANNTSDTTDAEVVVDQTTEQIAEDKDTDTEDLVYFTFMNNQMQTALAEMAEQKASSDDVKRLGRDMVEENKQVAAQIEDLAKAAALPLPQGLEVEQQQKIDSIQALSSQEFDKAFINLMLEQQDENIEMLEEMASSADNAIIRGLAADIVDSEKSQIERAEAVKDKMM